MTHNPRPAAEPDPAGPRTRQRRPPRHRPDGPERRPRPRFTLAVTGAVATLSVALAGTWAFGTAGPGGDPDAACPAGRRTLTVAAAPEVATVLAGATEKDAGSILGTRDACIDVRVSAAAPADVATALRGSSGDRADRPDVWVPDSSLWLRAPLSPGLGDPTRAVSIARSPLVLAVSRDVAGTLGWPHAPLDLIATMASDGQPRLGLPDPERSAPARAALLALDAALSARTDGQQRLAATMRAADTSLPDDAGPLLDSLAGGAPIAVPVAEQVVWANGNRAGAPGVVASYPAAGPALDYPLVVLATDAGRKADALLLRDAVTRPAWAKIARAAGFRDSSGAAGAALADREGIDPALGGDAEAPDPTGTEDAVRAFDAITLGTRMLAVIDVSGSMATEVPGAPGRTFMDVAVGAASGGLALYPDEAEVGLWTFSTDLTATSDHRELAPIGPLGMQRDGVRGRERLARALAGVTYLPHGDTGLYDTALDAVRAVRAGWDADSVNSVVLLTDGANDDDASISLDRLLTVLEQEATDSPVPVIGIAIGPRSDVAALREISRVTGGTTYAVQDPRRIHEVLADALATRPCRPTC